MTELTDDALRAIERTALELARLAGVEASAAFGRTLAIRYKAGDAAATAHAEVFRDPVSDVDHRVETLIRARLAEAHPDHDVLGEEIAERPGRGHDVVWAIDPIDGTTNFINGFPLFAASIGVLHRGRPVVGAVWCSTSHALRPGVYHARAGGPLCFEEDVLAPRDNPDIQRHLAGQPDAREAGDLPWDGRKTGSASLECAFVAAGLLRIARFATPNAWDVAGGIPLIAAAGGVVLQGAEGGTWEPLDTLFGPSGDLGDWRKPMLLGRADAVERLRAAIPAG